MQHASKFQSNTPHIRQTYICRLSGSSWVIHCGEIVMIAKEAVRISDRGASSVALLLAVWGVRGDS